MKMYETQSVSLSVDKVYSRLGTALNGLLKAASGHMEENKRFKGAEVHGRRRKHAA